MQQEQAKPSQVNAKPPRSLDYNNLVTPQPVAEPIGDTSKVPTGVLYKGEYMDAVNLLGNVD